MLMRRARDEKMKFAKLLSAIEIAFGLTPFTGSLSRTLNIDELERPSVPRAFQLGLVAA